MREIKVEGKAGFEQSLSLIVERADGTVEDLGVVCRKLVTDAWCRFLVDVLQSPDTTFSDFKYHDFGTGVTVQKVTDTALETPTGEAREVGTQTEGATRNIYLSLAVHSFASAFTITEHGLFNAAASGTLMDRSVLDGVAMAIGDRIRATYQLTANSGG